MASIQKRVTTRTVIHASGRERVVTTTRHRARYRDEAGKEHSRHFPRKVDAQKWLDEVTASMVTGMYVDPKAGQATLRAYAKTWQSIQVSSPGTGGSSTTRYGCTSSRHWATIAWRRSGGATSKRWSRSSRARGSRPARSATSSR